MGDIAELCKHDMTRQFCSWCKDKPSAESRNARLWNKGAGEPEFAVPMIEAQYNSICPECGCEIEAGDAIVLRAGEWWCIGCAYHDDIEAAKKLHPSGGDHGIKPTG